MNPTRIWAIVLRHVYLTKHQLERLFDVFVLPIVGLMLWGFVSTYLQSAQSPGFLSFLVGGLILWIIFERVGTDIGVSFMFDVWERNIVNVLATPLKLSEYVIGLVLVSIAKILVSFVAMCLVAGIFYGFNIGSLGFSLVALWINLIIFAVTLGIFNIAIVVRYGHVIGPLVWILPFLLQPFSAVFYPVSIMPAAVQAIAWFLPISHVFEGMRYAFQTGNLDVNQFLVALVLNLVYFAIAVALYVYMFNLVKRKGTLVKL